MEELEDRSLEVLDIPADLEDDLLQLYFENRRRSGGGALVSLDRHGDRAVLVFEKAEVADRVVSKDLHKLSDCKLTVRRKPPKDHGKFVLRGLSPSTSEDMLQLYVENLTGVRSDEYSLYTSPGLDLVLIHLHQPPADSLQKISEKVSSRKLNGVKISLEEVERTDSVLVENLPSSVTEDMLLLYFESSSRSGGGDVMDVSRTAKGFKVTFEDVECVDRVLQKSHKLSETELSVRPYFSFLETEDNEVPASLRNGTNQHSDQSLSPKSPKPRSPVTPTSPVTSASSPLTLASVSSPLVSASASSPLVSASASSPLVSASASSPLTSASASSPLISPSASSPLTSASASSPLASASSPLASASSPLASASASSPLASASASSSLASASASSPLTSVSASSPLTSAPVYFPHTSASASSPLTSASASSPLTSASASSPIASDSASSPLTSASASSPLASASASSTHTSAPALNGDKDAMEVLPSKPERFSCQISVPDPVKLQLVHLSGFLEDLKQAHPQFDFTLAKDSIRVNAPGRFEAEKIKNRVLEFLSGFSQGHVQVTDLRAKFLEKESVKDKILSLLKDEGLPSVYSLADCLLFVTSPTLSMVKQACEKIKSLVSETSVSVVPEYESMLYSQEWAEFVHSLDVCNAEVGSNGATLTVVTLKGLEEEMKSRLVLFLSTPIQKELVLSMEPAMLAYIQLHHQQLLFDLSHLSIFPLDTGDGLVVQGNANECQIGWEVLGSVVSSTHTKVITVSQPGISRFLLGDEASSILGEMTAKFQVYISLDKVHWRPLEDEDIFELAWKTTSCQNFQRDLSAEPMSSRSTAADKHTTARIEEAKRIISVIERSPEPSSLRVDDEEDLYSSPDLADDAQLMEAEDQRMSSNPCSLEEDAELSLAIQMSMETTLGRDQAEEDLRKALELSRDQCVMEAESQMVEKAVEVSLQEAVKSANVAEIKVFASYTHDLIRVDIALGKKVGLRQCEEKVEHKSLKKLSAYYKRCVDLVKRKHAVEIQIQGTTAIVSGFKDYVSEALPDLHKVLMRAANSVTDAEILKSVRWVRSGDGGSEMDPYPPEATVFIENAWRMKRKNVDVLFNNQTFTIDLEKMQEVDVSSGKSVSITRKMGSSEDLYTELQDEEYSLLSDVPDTCRVDENSAEFRDVVGEFYDSIREYHNKIKIIRVEKLMNKLLYNQYRLKKASMEQSASLMQVERNLFHGTSETSVKEICVHGFNRSFCGKNATVYGQGVYFAVESHLSLSDTYSPPNADGHKFIFMAKVLTGDFTLGKHEMKTAPRKDESGTLERYDSVADQMDSPTLFVIFNDTQAYPQYLITCQKIF